MKNVIRFGLYTLLPFGLVITIFLVSLSTSVNATQKNPNKIVSYIQSEELKSVNYDEDVILYLNDFDYIKGARGFIHYCEIDLFSNTMECCINYDFLLRETDIINTFLAKN